MTLNKGALDDERHGWLKETASVAQLRHVFMLLVRTLEATLLPGGVPAASEPPDAQAQERWRQRYAALPRLRQAGIQTVADEQAGAEAYVAACRLGPLGRGARALSWPTRWMT